MAEWWRERVVCVGDKVSGYGGMAAKLKGPLQKERSYQAGSEIGDAS
jgi:hypothetical protein